MAIRVACPNCGKAYKLKDTMAGKKFRCRGEGCAAVVRVPSAEGALPVPKKEKESRLGPAVGTAPAAKPVPSSPPAPEPEPGLQLAPKPEIPSPPASEPEPEFPGAAEGKTLASSAEEELPTAVEELPAPAAEEMRLGFKKKKKKSRISEAAVPTPAAVATEGEEGEVPEAVSPEAEEAIVARRLRRNRGRRGIGRIEREERGVAYARKFAALHLVIAALAGFILGLILGGLLFGRPGAAAPKLPQPPPEKTSSEKTAGLRHYTPTDQANVRDA